MRKALAVAVAVVLVLGVVGGVVVAGGTSMSRVIIGFKGAPDANLVKGVGGEVGHVYGIVPAVSAILPEAAIQGLKNNPKVAYVEPDVVVYALAQTLPWGVNRIDADVVHATGNKGAGAKVCVIDTGIDMDHPDLAYVGGYDFVNGDSYPDDDNGHGSHCAGIVAALDNTIGVIGVAPAAGLYGCKVLDAAGSGYTSDCVAGIDWARANGMDVASMSWGSSQTTTTLQDACTNAWNAGLVLVGAAGNSGNKAGKGDNVIYPAKYDTVIAVAATDSADKRASWSSTGPAVEIAAPGVSIYSTYYNGGYATMSGTSMACPHVAGVACLVLCAHPAYTNQQVRNAMDFTAIDLGAAGRDTLYGYGLVYAPNAVAY